MPTRYHVNTEDELLSVHIEGPVDLVEVYELGQSILRDPAFDPTWPQLVDIRGMQLRVRTGALKPFVEYVTGHYRPATGGTMALVVDGDLAADQVAGIFRLVCAMPNTEMFDDYALAIKWLLSKNWHTPEMIATTLAPSLQPQDAGREQANETPEPEWARQGDEARERFLAAAHGQPPHGDAGSHY